MVSYGDRNYPWKSDSYDLLPEDQPYVAAKFLGQDIPYTFNLGDGETRYGYFNRPLLKEKRYRIFVRVQVDKITKVSLGEPECFNVSRESITGTHKDKSICFSALRPGE